ncbi:hypothetical protein C8T65DRAFT_744773 [Cerioporus squamosus]|nr:hypothetical protein C8T65DRAFT_744773 [Cerioporus squamosus]
MFSIVTSSADALTELQTLKLTISILHSDLESALERFCEENGLTFSNSSVWEQQFTSTLRELNFQFRAAALTDIRENARHARARDAAGDVGRTTSTASAFLRAKKSHVAAVLARYERKQEQFSPEQRDIMKSQILSLTNLYDGCLEEERCLRYHSRRVNDWLALLNLPESAFNARLNSLLTEGYNPPAQAYHGPLNMLCELRAERDHILDATYVAHAAAAASGWITCDVPQVVWGRELSEVRSFRNTLLKQSRVQEDAFTDLRDAMLSAKCSSTATHYPLGGSFEICDLRRSLRTFEDVERYYASAAEVHKTIEALLADLEYTLYAATYKVLAFRVCSAPAQALSSLPEEEIPVMIEPEQPVTIHVKHSPYPAVELSGKQNVQLKPYSVILRHRHLKQQHTVVAGNGLNGGVSETPAKSTRGKLVIYASKAIPGAPQITSNPEPSSGLQANPAPDRAPAPSLPVPPAVAQPSIPPAAPLPAQPVRVPAPLRSTGAASENVDVIGSQRTSTGLLSVTRTEHMMRLPARDKTVWFSSRADDLLAAPPSIQPSQVRFGDLYIHYSAGDRKQIWLRTADACWEAVNLYHPHPYIPGYVLNVISSGEPSWVKAETIRTYEGRLKKRQRDAAKAPPTGVTPLTHTVSSQSNLHYRDKLRVNPLRIVS